MLQIEPIFCRKDVQYYWVLYLRLIDPTKGYGQESSGLFESAFVVPIR